MFIYSTGNDMQQVRECTISIIYLCLGPDWRREPSLLMSNNAVTKETQRMSTPKQHTAGRHVGVKLVQHTAGRHVYVSNSCNVLQVDTCMCQTRATCCRSTRICVKLVQHTAGRHVGVKLVQHTNQKALARRGKNTTKILKENNIYSTHNTVQCCTRHAILDTQHRAVLYSPCNTRHTIQCSDALAMHSLLIEYEF